MGNKLYLITNYEIDPIKARLDSVQNFLADKIAIDEEVNIHLFSCLSRLQETIMHLELYYQSIGYDPLSDKKSNI